MSKSSASSSRFSGDVMTEAHSRVGSQSRFVVRVGRISHGLWQPSKSGSGEEVYGPELLAVVRLGGATAKPR
ncbi:hypothetical protein OROHE_022643 [Orobanche hederae]